MKRKYYNLFLSQIKIDLSWDEFLTESIITEIENIEEKLRNICNSDFSTITPDTSKVLRFLSIPIDNIKVIVLGQDPYPQKGVATGRAFEVGNLISWSQTYRNPSLQNIIRNIYKAYSNEIKTYKLIKQELDNCFKILSPPKAFSSWEQQGVLFLNTSYTCTINESNSHIKIWQDFSSALLKFIAKKNTEAVWFLWGNNARDITADLDLKNSIFTYHPSRCNNREKDFLYGEINCFAETKHLINWAEYKNEINPLL